MRRSWIVLGVVIVAIVVAIVLLLRPPRQAVPPGQTISGGSLPTKPSTESPTEPVKPAEGKENAKEPVTPPKKLEAVDAEEGWKVLFDGKGLDAWNNKATGGWTIDADGAMAWQRGCGYVWTKEQFGNFVLDCDFKVAKGANSGIFIRTAKPNNCVQTGIEVQILDSVGREKPGKHDCCSIFDCLAPSKNAEKPVGEWNHVTIACRDNKIEVVLNGEKIIDMDLDQWTEAGKNPDGSRNRFGTAYKDMARKGFIGLQDNGIAVWYRNIKIKELPEKQSI